MRYIRHGLVSPPRRGGDKPKLIMPRRIAIVEDDAAIRANYADALRKHGYEVSAHAARAEPMRAFRTRLPDLAVIDIGLGEEPDGGFTLCRELRAMAPGLPILFLTARDSDFDAVSGLRLGADDYLTKDVSLPHLLARISALFRRMDALREPKAVEEVLERGALKLDAKRFTASWKNQSVGLTLTEFWMVHTLAKFPGPGKGRGALMGDANLVVDEGPITSQVKPIRRKFAAVHPSFTTRLASRITVSRSFTWPGNFASVCTIQNSVSVSATGSSLHAAVKRFASSLSSPRSSSSSAALGSRSASILRNSAEMRASRCGRLTSLVR